MQAMHSQLDLFAQVANAYASAPGSALSNEALYSALQERLGVSREEANARVPIGRSGQKHSTFKRRVRFLQQSLKHMGILERTAGTRGIWSLTAAAGKRLNRAGNGVRLVAFSTSLGVALWSNNVDSLSGLDEPISLIFGSPPFPLAKPRDYGNPDEKTFCSWMIRQIEPMLKHLAPGGCVAIQLSPDIFERGVPTRSLYQERLLIALRDELSLHRISSIPWCNFSKPPGPTHWALKNPIQLVSAHEFIHVLTNDPLKCKANNRRILEAHTERHKALMAAGGEKREAVYGDGAYRLHVGSFGRQTEGRLPRNVIEMGHICPDTLALRRRAKELGLPAHGASYPTRLADQIIRYLTEPDDLVFDPWSGSGKTALAAQRGGRRWIAAEIILEYARLSAESFRNFEGFWMSPAMAAQVGNAA